MKHQLIMLETPIIVSDEEIRDVRSVKGQWHLEKGNIINQFPDYLTDLSECKLIIAGIENLPTIDYNGFEDKVGHVDVEKLACETYKIKNGLNDYEEKYFNSHGIAIANGFIEGFKKAQQLNNKKFSLEETSIMFYDMIRSISEGTLRKWNPDDFGKFIESIQKLKVFDIELETEEVWFHGSGYYTKDQISKEVQETYTPMKELRPKIINNKIKITRVL